MIHQHELIAREFLPIINHIEHLVAVRGAAEVLAVQFNDRETLNPDLHALWNEQEFFVMIGVFPHIAHGHLVVRAQYG